MDEVSKLIESIKRTGELSRQAQIRFVECVSVDWNNKTMTARGTADNLEYLDVSLGFGYIDIKPASGSLCLIGLIDGQEVFSFLINAETVDLVETKAGKMVFNGGENDGLVKVNELTQKLNAIEKDINALKTAFSTWVTVPSDGGAALKAATTTWVNNGRLSETQATEIQNDKIIH